MMTTRKILACSPVGAALAIVLLSASDGAAQLPPTPGQLRETQIRAELKARADRIKGLERFTFPYSAMPRQVPFEFHLGHRAGLQQLFPRYEGLPTYPSNVPGYGGYPGAGSDPGAADLAKPGKLAPGLERPPGKKDAWPSWIDKGTGKANGRATAQQAVLARLTDRVWFLAPGEPAYVPIEYHDRFRFLQVGSRVDVRGKGEYQVILHDGASLRSRGPCKLTIVAMNEKEFAIQMPVVSNVWFHAKLRPVRLQLPDGTELQFTDTFVHLTRRGDRCRVSNEGKSPVKFVGSAGQGELDGLVYIDVWMKPPARPPRSDPIRLSGEVSMTQSDRSTTVRGGANGRVEWSGASFDVGSGTTLEIQPLKRPR